MINVLCIFLIRALSARTKGLRTHAPSVGHTVRQTGHKLVNMRPGSAFGTLNYKSSFNLSSIFSGVTAGA